MTESEKLIVKGGLLVTPLEERPGDVLVDKGRIAAAGGFIRPDDGPVVDANGCYVTPGLFDLQVNGGPECDFWGTPDESGLAAFCRRLSSAGVTSFLPTVITDSVERMSQRARLLRSAMGAGFLDLSNRLTCRMPGVHLEGPCLSPQRPGVHPVEHLKPLTRDVLESVLDQGVSLITLAPELDPTGDCLRFLSERRIKVSLGHSDASLEEAQSAFALGVRMVTHTFNALPGIHHRKPGAVTAALINEDVWCCMIADGKHLSPAVCRLIVAAKGAERTILATDVAAVGTSRGGLVGSSILLDQAVRNVVEWNVADFKEAVLMASYNPARAMGLDGELGLIEPGRLADLVLWDRHTLAIKNVILNGRLLPRPG